MTMNVSNIQYHKNPAWREKMRKKVRHDRSKLNSSSPVLNWSNQLANFAPSEAAQWRRIFHARAPLAALLNYTILIRKGAIQMWASTHIRYFWPYAAPETKSLFIFFLRVNCPKIECTSLHLIAQCPQVRNRNNPHIHNDNERVQFTRGRVKCRQPNPCQYIFFWRWNFPV